MMHRLVAVAFLAVALHPAPASAGDPVSAAPQKSKTGCPHSSMWKPTELELHRILAQHVGWLQRIGEIRPSAHNHYLEQLKPTYSDWQREAQSHPRRARLCNAELAWAQLSSASLRGADLRGADLNSAMLFKTDLSAADLSDADLSQAHLFDAHMEGAKLRNAILFGARAIDAHLDSADLTSAYLFGTDLRGADLTGADLSNAVLFQADLDGAVLENVKVSKAKLAYVVLTSAIYAPVSEPPDPYVAGIVGLSTLRVPSGNSMGLVQLRKALHDGGFRDAEREATHAIEVNSTSWQFTSAPMVVQRVLTDLGLIDIVPDRSSRARLDSAVSFGWIGGFLRILAFDITTGYGLYPTRALVMIIVIGGLFTLVYMWPMRQTLKTPGPVSGIYQVFPADRINPTLTSPIVVKQRAVVRVQANNWWRAFCAAAYFSLLCSANIGFEQFTPGDWIRRLQGRDYSLEAIGWVRIVAGVQALISVFLLAMWALTQFGHPFE